MNPQPETVALAGYVVCLILCPLVVAALVFTPSPHGKWIMRGFALVLAVLWAPLALGAPQILAALS